MTEPNQTTDDTANTAPATGDDGGQGVAPMVSGDDVRVGPELSDEPEAGTTEPTD